MTSWRVFAKAKVCGDGCIKDFLLLLLTQSVWHLVLVREKGGFAGGFKSRKMGGGELEKTQFVVQSQKPWK